MFFHFLSFSFIFFHFLSFSFIFFHFLFFHFSFIFFHFLFLGWVLQICFILALNFVTISFDSSYVKNVTPLGPLFLFFLLFFSPVFCLFSCFLYFHFLIIFCSFLHFLIF